MRTRTSQRETVLHSVSRYNEREAPAAAPVTSQTPVSGAACHLLIHVQDMVTHAGKSMRDAAVEAVAEEVAHLDSSKRMVMMMPGRMASASIAAAAAAAAVIDR